MSEDTQKQTKMKKGIFFIIILLVVVYIVKVIYERTRRSISSHIADKTVTGDFQNNIHDENKTATDIRNESNENIKPTDTTTHNIFGTYYLVETFHEERDIVDFYKNKHENTSEIMTDIDILNKNDMISSDFVEKYKHRDWGILYLNTKNRTTHGTSHALIPYWETKTETIFLSHIHRYFDELDLKNAYCFRTLNTTPRKLLKILEDKNYIFFDNKLYRKVIIDNN